MTHSDYTSQILSQLIKKPLDVRHYGDHASLIYTNFIFEIYAERIRVISINDEEIDIEIIKINEIKYLNILLDNNQ